jgi:hypothetical protein
MEIVSAKVKFGHNCGPMILIVYKLFIELYEPIIMDNKKGRNDGRCEKDCLKKEQI